MLHGNRYQVEPELVGHKVELVFAPAAPAEPPAEAVDLTDTAAES
ncbi:hypothetical protein [Streptomyces sp. NPDC006132]